MTRRFRCIKTKFLGTWCDDGNVSTLASLVTGTDIVTDKLAMIHKVVLSEAEYSGAESNNGLMYHSLVFYFIPCFICFFLGFYFLVLSYSLISVFHNSFPSCFNLISCYLSWYAFSEPGTLEDLLEIGSNFVWKCICKLKNNDLKVWYFKTTASEFLVTACTLSLARISFI